MRNQFFYTRKINKEIVDHSNPTGPKVVEIVEVRDSFNVDAVIRSITMADGTVLVLLNDIHERTTETPTISTKNNKVTGSTRKRDTYQSEIYLSPEDGIRFYNDTAISEVKINNLMELENANQTITG